MAGAVEADSIDREEKKALDSAYTTGQREEKKQGTKLKVTKRPNETKKSTFIKPRRKGF